MSTPHPDIVRDAINRSGIQKKDLAQRTGMNVNSLTGVEKPEWNPRWQTLQKLCAAVAQIKRERA